MPAKKPVDTRIASIPGIDTHSDWAPMIESADRPPTTQEVALARLGRARHQIKMLQVWVQEEMNQSNAVRADPKTRPSMRLAYDQITYDLRTRMRAIERLLQSLEALKKDIDP